MHDREFLIWLLNRLVHVHGENPDVDYILKLGSIIRRMSAEQLTPNTAPSDFIKGLLK